MPPQISEMPAAEELGIPSVASSGGEGSTVTPAEPGLGGVSGHVAATAADLSARESAAIAALEVGGGGSGAVAVAPAAVAPEVQKGSTAGEEAGVSGELGSGPAAVGDSRGVSGVGGSGEEKPGAAADEGDVGVPGMDGEDPTGTPDAGVENVPKTGMPAGSTALPSEATAARPSR